MVRRSTQFVFSVVVLAAAIFLRIYQSKKNTQCRSIPGDDGWPNKVQWNTFNDTIQGRLIATVPIAAPCHAPWFDQDKCDALRDTWFYPETHLQSPSSPMAYPFGNDSCNPFQPPETACTLGSHVVYSVNASSAEHIQHAVNFARENNIRLVIRNTGHDYLGKSTGAHTLAIWTRHLKSQELLDEYHGGDMDYSGPAIRVGAGVEMQEAYDFADANNLMVVGGNCPNIGFAGGYAQGGGHGPLASRLGLAADQVLEWEVVTAQGDLVTASPSSHPDLFWALRGGGGGTYAVVTSMTVKAFPNTFVSTATLQVFNDGTNSDAIYDLFGTLLKNLPALVDAGAIATWIAGPFGILLSPAMAPGIHKDELDELLQPTRRKLEQLNLNHQYASIEHPSFLSSYNSLTSSWNVSDYNAGGRLIPRKLVEDNTTDLVKAIRYISERTICTGVVMNVAHAASDKVAVNPYWRESLFSLAVGTPIDYTDFAANKAAHDRITNEFLPQVEKLTPNGGAYLSEADFQARDWQSLFYGRNYDKLLAIKARYDPKDVFYAKTAVGSDGWIERSDGRLCRL